MVVVNLFNLLLFIVHPPCGVAVVVPAVGMCAVCLDLKRTSFTAWTEETVS